MRALVRLTAATISLISGPPVFSASHQGTGGAAVLALAGTARPYGSAHEAPPVERRQSRRRFNADNTQGRVARAKLLVDKMKTKSPDEAKAFYDTLMPRDKLDVVRILNVKRAKRLRERTRSPLPKYRSSLFARRYFFREQDLTEQSTLGRGPGGQATNRRMQTVILTHTPTGLVVKFSRFPSLWLNRRASRELLNARLEERLIGEDSELGRAKAQKEKRRKRNLVDRERMVVKGNKLAARSGTQCDYFAVLTSRSPLPASAVAQLGITARTQPLFVADLFNDECQNWWPLLQHAFAQCPPVPSPEAEVPLLLQHLFPRPSPNAKGPVARREQAQVDLCRQDDAAVENVRRALRCFSELYGLPLVALPPRADNKPRCALVKDGMNWRELRCRLHSADGARAMPNARAAWRHVYGSLTAMGMGAEALALRRFLSLEARREKEAAGEACGWAAELCEALKTSPPKPSKQPPECLAPAVATAPVSVAVSIHNTAPRLL